MAADTVNKRRHHFSGDSHDSQYIPLPPDGGYGWVIVMASFINHVIVDGITFTFGIFYGEFLEYFGASKGQTSLVGALLAGCYLLTAPFAGSMVNRFGCRAVSVAGALMASGAFVLSTFATSIHVLTITYGILGGIGLGLLYLPNVISVSYYFEKHRAVATGIAVCGAGVGCFIMAPVGRWLLDIYDWKNAMLIVAGITLNGCVFGALLRPLVAPCYKNSRKALSEMIMDEDIATTIDADMRPDSAILVDELLPLEDNDLHLLQVPTSLLAADATLNKSEIQVYPINDLPAQRKFTSFFAIPRRRSFSDALPSLDHDDKVITKSGNKRFDKARELSMENNKIKLGQTHNRRYRSEMCFGANGGRVPVEKLDCVRPMYRRDIFYSGSRLRIPEFQQQSNTKRYFWQFKDDRRRSSEDIESPKGRCCGLPPISKVMNDVWRRMTNLSLLKQPLFLVSCLGNLFGTVGLFVPFVYCAERAISMGVDSHYAALLLSVIGVTNTFGRIAAGCLASLPRVNSLLLHNVALVSAGLACIGQAMFGVDFATMAVWSALFGLCIATWISLTSVVLCDLLGLELLTNAFGLLTMTRGLAAMVGSPAAGFIYDITGNYDASFYVGGAMLTFGGLLCCLLHLPHFNNNVQQQRIETPESGFEDLDSNFDIVPKATRKQ